MPRSQLLFTTVGPAEEPAQLVVVPLHDYGGQTSDLIPLAQAVGSRAELRIPRAPRPAYFGRNTVSHYWYIGERKGLPDPPSFGDCLFQLEQFVLDLAESRGEIGHAPILLGVGQGAVLALAATKVMPDYLGGVIAIAGYLPRIPGLKLPIDDLDQLPILMVNGPRDRARRLVEASAARLEQEGARIELHDNVDTSEQTSRELCRLVASWSRRVLASRLDERRLDASGLDTGDPNAAD